MTNNVLLVGSVPLDSVEEVFRSFGGPLGDELATMPDGEVGPRRHWISRVHYQVLSGHADLETVRRPKPENGVERLNPREASDSWLFKVRDGVERVRFGELGWRLGYARDAINSYFVFKTLREKGELARHLRFQVSLPSINSALPPRIFPDRNDIAKIRPGYQDVLAAEIGTIVAKIPHKDLAIQWDVCIEMVMFDGRFYPGGWPDPGKGTAERLARISKPIPRGVELGIHLCYGDLDGAHFIQPQDLGKAVGLANIICKAVKRPIHWMSMPVPRDRSDDAFFAPLKDLKMHKETELVLGLVHSEDGVAGTNKRIATASKYAKDFAVATECGIGRKWSPKEVAPLLRVHAAVTTG
jgi:hypothetical protein